MKKVLAAVTVLSLAGALSLQAQGGRGGRQGGKPAPGHRPAAVRPSAVRPVQPKPRPAAVKPTPRKPRPAAVKPTPPPRRGPLPPPPPPKRRPWWKFW